MGFIYISDGIDDALAVHLNQILDAWTGVSGKGVPFNGINVNDPINFAVSARNLDPTNSRTAQFLKADGTVLFQVDASGVKVSPDGTTASVPVTTASTQTLTNKTFTSPMLTDPTVTGSLTATGLVTTAALAAGAVSTVAYVESTAVGNTLSTTLADLPNLTTPITTGGGNLLCFASLSCSNSGAGNVTTFTFNLDSASESNYAEFSQPVANGSTQIMFLGRFIGVAAGAHTVKCRWKVTAGTTTINVNTLRVLMVLELKR
jgi:hypothetical protein